MDSVVSQFDLKETSGSIRKDQAALEEFTRRLLGIRPQLSGFLYSRTGGCLPATEDCLQEVAVVLWKKHDPDWEEEVFRRYAFRCAELEAKEYHRKRKRGGKRIVFLAPDVVREIGDEVADRIALDPAEYDDRLEALQECLDSLDAPQRELVDARYERAEGFETLAEIAEKRGVKLETLYKRLERVRRSLHRCILKRLKRSSP